MPTLFDPVALGAISLANRIVMAPMTRSRAGEGDVPNALMTEYYRQRASAGLIVTEGTQPSATGKGYCRTPGLHNAAQAAGWRAVTDAVHDAGGRIVVQLMHCGRVGSRLNKHPDAETVAPSAVQARGKIFADGAGQVEMDAPRALETQEIAGIVEEYAQSARLALAAGFDGVELHCASGYLPMQFLSTGTNRRTDRYGGSVANRIRFTIEVLEALSGAIGADRVGFRICPGNPFNDIHDDDPAETYAALLQAAAPLGLAYLHLIRLNLPQVDGVAVAAANWRGKLILNESIDFTEAQQIVGDGRADAISFGRAYIGNPDLVRRFREGAPLAPFELKGLYAAGPEGYTDYPALAES
ncbi:MAG: alkene reductase [Sphingomonas sp.]|nr:alkene reductase [Sphingomonas sp.]